MIFKEENHNINLDVLSDSHESFKTVSTNVKQAQVKK